MEKPSVKNLLADTLVISQSEEQLLKKEYVALTSQNRILETLLNLVRAKDEINDHNQRTEIRSHNVSQEAFKDFISVLAPTEAIKLDYTDRFNGSSYFILLDNNTLLLLDGFLRYRPSIIQTLDGQECSIHMGFRIININEPLNLVPLESNNQNGVKVTGTTYTLYYREPEDQSLLGTDFRELLTPITIEEISTRYMAKLKEKKKVDVKEI